MNRQVRLVTAAVALGLVASGCTPVRGLGNLGAPHTRVELVAVPADDAPVTPEAMDTAVEVIQLRLAAEGREATDVVVDEDSITLEVVGEVDDETRALISERGELAFRPVLLAGAPGPDGGPDGHDRTGVAPEVWTAFEALDCTAPQTIAENIAGGGDPDLPLVTCGQEGDTKYVLGPVEVAGTALTEVSSGLQADYDGGAVFLQFDERGTEEFRETTERLQGLTEPRNQIAVTLDDLVVSAPSIMVVITTGEVEITGSFTEESAATLASQLAADPLPYPFEVRDVATTE